MAVRPKSAASVTPPLALLAALVLVAPSAAADKTADAEDLFRRAKGLIAQNKYDEACPLLEESYRLERVRGTLLNLALCHERIGKTASAWGEFRAVEQQERALPAPNESRVQLAREHAEKLQPRLSRLRIIVPADARAPGLVVKVDGEPRSEPLWAGVPVDPGTRSVEASAANKKPVVLQVKVDDEGMTVPVTIPALADAPVAAAAPAGNAADLDAAEEYASNRARRTIGFVIGGIGLVTLAVGAAFGVGAIINDNEAKKCSPCVRGSEGASASDQATDRALVFANISNVTVPLGAIGTVVGAYLVLSAGPSRKVALVPTTSAHSAGLSMSGAW